MLLHFEDGQPFSQGACALSCRPIRENDDSLRIVVPAKIEGREVQAVIDTGGVYLCCDQETAQGLRPRLDPAQGIPTKLHVAGIGKCPGHLHDLALTLVAEQGTGIELEVTAFVPDQDTTWNLPAMLGFQGCLERLCFAIDLKTDTFHFGTISEEY